MPQNNLARQALTALLIGVYFIVLTKDAVLCYFSPDDITTIYRSWIHPASALVRANLVFFLNSPFYRPVGSDFYRGMFELSGLNPVPFHIANLCLLGANIWFTYCVARRLTGSQTAGALAALLIAYHGRFISLYFDTGYIYDVLCYFFYFAALLFYLRVRSHGGPPRAWELAVFSALFICALNAKEMAVTLPVSMLVYEWLYHREAMGSIGKLRTWAMAEGRGVLVAGLLTLMFVIGRTRGAGLMENPAFQPVFTWQRFAETSVKFVSPLFFRDNLFPMAAVIVIWLVLFAAAWTLRLRALKFAWLFLMFSVLPVAFILPRGPGQYYITYFGWVLYAATLLDELSVRLMRRFQSEWTLALLVGVAAILYGINSNYKWSDVSAVAVEGEELRIIAGQIHRLQPVIRHGSRILFLNDPIDERWWMQFLLSMSYRDKDLVVDRARFMEKPPSAAEIAAYDYVFDYRHGRFYPSPLPPVVGPQPEIVYEYGLPAVYHSDWTRVTERQPAKAGEGVISIMEDLDGTAVEVLVDGKVTEVLQRVISPDGVNRYRVDFRIPEAARAGDLEVVVTNGGHTGPGTPVPVRELSALERRVER